MRSCDQLNAFLSTFGSYTPKQKSRMAYEVKQEDKLNFVTGNRAVLTTAKGQIEFNIQANRFVSEGDFIEIIQWPNYAVHWPRSQFLAQNVQPGDTVINRGDAVLELCTGTDSLAVAGKVIKIKDRYFASIENGRVITSWSLAGAERFCRHHDAKKLQKTLAELAARKKKTQVLEVGMWSRTVEEVQGGAA